MPYCKIIIQDEVNVKFEGLPAEVRRSLSSKFEYKIPGIEYTASYKLGRWNGKKKFFQIGGTSFFNLVPEIVEVLDEYDYTYEIVDARDYDFVPEFKHVSIDEYSHFVWPKGHPLEGQPILLNGHQVTSINTFLDNPQSIGSISTGAGKTIITAALVERMQHHGRSIIIVPSKSLVYQTVADLKLFELDAGVFFGDLKEVGKQHTVCTWQSLHALAKASEEGKSVVPIEEFLKGVNCVIVDECHTAKAEVLLSLLSTILAKVPIRWGFTGTIPKEEMFRLSLKVGLGEVVTTIRAVELQDKGILAKCHVKVLQLQDFMAFKQYPDEIAYLSTNEKRLSAICQMVEDIRKSGNTLILVTRIETGKFFEDHIPNSKFINGSVDAKKRKNEYDEIQYNDGIVLIATYGVASTGINISRLFNVVLFEAGRSFTQVIQSVGRGLRIAEDKNFVQIYDICSSCKRSKSQLTDRKKFYAEAEYPYTIQKVVYK